VRRVALPALLAFLASACLGGSSSHSAIAAGAAQTQLAEVSEFSRVHVTPRDVIYCGGPETKNRYRFVSRYSVGITDRRMPVDSENSARASISAFVFAKPSQAKRCYDWLRSGDFVRYVQDKAHPGMYVRQDLHPSVVGHYTLKIFPIKPGTPGAAKDATGEYDTLVLSGHTLAYGEASNEPDALRVEADALKLRDVVGV
jgi:hypothetical protein